VGKKGENPKETDKLTYDPSIGIAAPYDDSKMNGTKRMDNDTIVVDRRNIDKDSNCKGDNDDDDDDDNGSRDNKLSVMISIDDDDDDEEKDDDDNGSSDIKSNNKSPNYDNNVIHQHVPHSIEDDNHNNSNYNNNNNVNYNNNNNNDNIKSNQQQSINKITSNYSYHAPSIRIDNNVENSTKTQLPIIDRSLKPKLSNFKTHAPSTMDESNSIKNQFPSPAFDKTHPFPPLPPDSSHQQQQQQQRFHSLSVGNNRSQQRMMINSDINLEKIDTNLITKQKSASEIPTTKPPPIKNPNSITTNPYSTITNSNSHTKNPHIIIPKNGKGLSKILRSIDSVQHSSSISSNINDINVSTHVSAANVFKESNLKESSLLLSTIKQSSHDKLQQVILRSKQQQQQHHHHQQQQQQRSSAKSPEPLHHKLTYDSLAHTESYLHYISSQPQLPIIDRSLKPKLNYFRTLDSRQKDDDNDGGDTVSIHATDVDENSSDKKTYDIPVSDVMIDVDDI
jgi:hypothetical protein